jgi:hypothetical protein
MNAAYHCPVYGHRSDPYSLWGVARIVVLEVAYLERLLWYKNVALLPNK